MPYREALCRRLSKPAAACLMGLSRQQAASLEEIRIRLNKPTELVIGQKAYYMDDMTDEKGMLDLVAALSGYALYRCEAQLSKGYLPLPDGHRAGICGKMIAKNGVACMAQITSVCIRIARMIPGAARMLYPYLMTEEGRVRRVLILGSPGYGKTTMIKDCALYLSEKGIHVAAADEREEMENLIDMAKGIDVLSGVDKAQAMMMLIRTMAPHAVITDEIGREEDADAILDAVRCGIGVLATAHADSLGDAEARPMLRRLMETRAFECYVVLNKHRDQPTVFDQEGRRMLEEREDEVKGIGHSGNDARQCSRFFAF
ncbi:MAG: hypothetical protein IJ381_06840 [Clostridia bacterium]|nr:hypothetical protein [Clostridia bacterium]